MKIKRLEMDINDRFTLDGEAIEVTPVGVPFVMINVHTSEDSIARTVGSALGFDERYLGKKVEGDYFYTRSNPNPSSSERDSVFAVQIYKASV